MKTDVMMQLGIAEMSDWVDWLSIFRTNYFRVGVSLASAALGVWIRSESRHPTKMKMTKEDFAVGIDLIQTSLFAFVALITERGLRLYDELSGQVYDPTNAMQLSKFLVTSGVQAAFFAILLAAMSSFVRRTGWRGPEDIKVLQGIAIPISVGVLCLYAVVGVAGASAQ